MSCQVAVVMPVYNEEACIESVVDEWIQLLGLLEGARLLVIDDGSKDETPRILERMAAQHPLHLFVWRQANAGHGAAVLRGYAEAVKMEARWVFQTDSDGQIPAEAFWQLWQRRGAGRFMQGVRQARNDAGSRLLLSAAHRALLLAMFGHAPADPNIPFRLMDGRLLGELCDWLPSRPFAPNVFLSLLAQRRDGFIDGIPVQHRDRQTGSGSIQGWKTVKVAWRCWKEIWRFRRVEYRQALAPE